MKGRTIRRLAILILIVAACILLIGGGSRSARPLVKQVTASQAGTVQSQSAVTIISSLPKLKLVSFKKLGDLFVLVTFRNDYEKDITAVTAFAGGIQYGREYVVSESEITKISPGESATFEYPNPPPGERIDIIAVVFGDRTGEGDRREIRRILDERLGMKIQLLRILPHFQRLASTSSATANLDLAAVKTIAAALPEQKDDHSPLSQGMESGLRHGKAYILRHYLGELEQALQNEKVETWYAYNGERQSVRYSPYEHFRMKFNVMQKNFTGLLKRL